MDESINTANKKQYSPKPPLSVIRIVCEVLIGAGVGFLYNNCEAGMMDGTSENLVLERRATVVVCQYSRKKWLFDVFAQLRLRFLRENPLISPEYC